MDRPTANTAVMSSTCGPISTDKPGCIGRSTKDPENVSRGWSAAMTFRARKPVSATNSSTCPEEKLHVQILEIPAVSWKEGEWEGGRGEFPYCHVRDQNQRDKRHDLPKTRQIHTSNGIAATSKKRSNLPPRGPTRCYAPAGLSRSKKTWANAENRLQDQQGV